ncbi:MAG: metallophosphoesterase [bacterium]|nr:metallophosphoesterase [bacterium]
MIRVAAVGDLHFRESYRGGVRSAFRTVSREADLLLIAGDLTGIGRPEEAAVLRRELSIVSIPTVVVLGNHDYHSDCEEDIKSILRDGGIIVLDGDFHKLDIRGTSIGLAGTKGFCGGFGIRQITPFGEIGIKEFLGHVEEETEKLDRALAGLNTDIKLVILHYSPVIDTLAGESPELYPFLGCSMLSIPVDRHGTDLVVHGHAHHGVELGQTDGGVPVRNVAMQVLRRYYIVYDLVGTGG